MVWRGNADGDLDKREGWIREERAEDERKNF